MSFFKLISRLFRAPFLWAIRLYQQTLSPDHGLFRSLFPNGFCKYHPSCSEYMRLSIERHGVFYGGLKGFWRIVRCNPCSRGGADPP